MGRTHPKKRSSQDAGSGQDTEAIQETDDDDGKSSSSGEFASILDTPVNKKQKVQKKKKSSSNTSTVQPPFPSLELNGHVIVSDENSEPATPKKKAAEKKVASAHKAKLHASQTRTSSPRGENTPYPLGILSISDMMSKHNENLEAESLQYPNKTPSSSDSRRKQKPRKAKSPKKLR